MLDIFETWHKRTSWNYRDDPSHDSPIGKPLYPEDLASPALV